MMAFFQSKNIPQNFSLSFQASQKGMALLTILLLVVAITIVAGSMLASQKIMQRQYVLTLTQDQMREYALMGEAWATQLVQQDSQANQSDSLQDSWAKPISPMQVENATIEIKIEDEASRFNLNNLYHDGKVDEQAVALFRKLLISQKINPAIANAVLDWQDADSDTRPEGGAEFDFYQSTGKAMPMPIANQPFVSVDELAWVQGVQKADFEKLKPLVTAVPFFLPINVNTAKPELLEAMFSSPDLPTSPTSTPATTMLTNPLSTVATTNPTAVQISAAQIESWANSRTTSVAITNMNEFWAVPVFASVTANQRQTMQNLLEVKSGAFSDRVKVTAEGRTLYLTSLLAKKTTSPTLANSGTVSQSNANLTQNVVAFNRRILPFLPDD